MDSQTLSSKIASIKGIPEKTTLETMLLDKTYQIRFKKLDGDERKMTCTKQEKSIPQNRLPKISPKAKYTIQYPPQKSQTSPPKHI